jgi:hypothetical protein
MVGQIAASHASAKRMAIMEYHVDVLPDRRRRVRLVHCRAEPAPPEMPCTLLPRMNTASIPPMGPVKAPPATHLRDLT